MSFLSKLLGNTKAKTAAESMIRDLLKITPKRRLIQDVLAVSQSCGNLSRSRVRDHIIHLIITLFKIIKSFTCKIIF